jgi:hypothetical protein
MAENGGAPPVALPPINDIIELPPEPQNPPTAGDIEASLSYKHDISLAVAHGMCN